MSQSYEVFVSYAREDLERVRPWADELKQGNVSAFFDMESLRAGSTWPKEIAEAIHSAKVVILFVSRSSMASEFVPRELALALELKKKIVPVFLEETQIQGELSLYIAGLQRVLAHDPNVTVRQHLLDIQPQLRVFGVDWKNPSQFLNGVRQVPRRNADEGAGAENQRFTRKQETKPAPAADAESPGKSWTMTWLVLMALAGAVIAFFWMDGLSWWSSVPRAVPLSMEEEAQDLASQYYLAANQTPAAQITLLADKVDYLGHQGWSPNEVKSDLVAYAKRWTRQQFEVLVKPPLVRVVEAGKMVECDVSLRCTSENAVVKNITTFTGRLRMQPTGGGLKITSVAEVPGTRKSEPLVFHPEAQKKAVIDFITRSVVSGSTSSEMKPDDIAGLYVESADYFGRTASREDIIKETQTLISRWEIREYRVLEGPEIISGLGTPSVEVKVGLDFLVSSRSRGGKSDHGWVRSVYLVRFSADGTPLIQKHAEIERGK